MCHSTCITVHIVDGTLTTGNEACHVHTSDGYMHTYVHICIHYINTHVYMHICICIHSYTYVYTIHYIHTRMHMLPCRPAGGENAVG